MVFALLDEGVGMAAKRDMSAALTPKAISIILPLSENLCQMKKMKKVLVLTSCEIVYQK